MDSKQPTPKGKLVLALMKRLVNDSESITDHTGLFCEFVSSFACKIYSKSYLQKQLKKKKGSRLLDVVTPSDMAMVTAVMENSHEVWKDEERINAMTRDEQEKFKKKNQGGMSEDEKEFYQKKMPKWTSNAGRKRGLMGVGWSGDGIKFYREVENALIGIIKDAEIWSQLEQGWDDYAMEHVDFEEWKPVDPTPLPLEDGSDVPDDQKLYTDFSMPGDDDYEDPLGWKQGLEEGEGTSDGEMIAGV